MHHALRNVWVIAHYACQTTGRDAETWDSSPGDATCCALLKSLRALRSGPVLSYISAPLPRLRCLHQWEDLGEPEEEFCGGINPDWHVKWGWIFLLQCPSALSGCVLASSPPPLCAYSGGAQSVVWGPPSGRPNCLSGGRPIHVWRKLNLSDWSWKLLKNTGAIIVQSYMSEQNERNSYSEFEY